MEILCCKKKSIICQALNEAVAEPWHILLVLLIRANHFFCNLTIPLSSMVIICFFNSNIDV